MMQAHAPASTRKPAGYFHRNGLLSQLISVLLAWTMVMSSLPVYATDQPRAAWVHSSGFDGALAAPWPQKTSSGPGEASHKLVAASLPGLKQRKERVGAERIQLASLKTPVGLGSTHALLQSNVTGESSIASNFNGTAIPGGSFIWFGSVFKASGLGSQPARVFLRSASLQFTAAGATYTLPVPDATITFSPTATSATTSFDSSKNAWITNLPSTGLAGNSFLSGMTFPVPASGLPGGINPVTWSGTFYSDTAGVSINWQWAAAVYTSFSGDYRTLNVKPVDDTSASVYKNSDHAGTPEAYKTFVTGGARGGGGSNYTGSYSATASVLPLNEVPNYPPVANAGPAQTVFVGTTVQLDGSGSTDQDGNPLTYRWSFVSIPNRSTAQLNGANTVKPTFVPDVPGSYTVQLIVNDGLVDSSPATVTISTKNSPPVANAGPDQTITTGATVQLDGSRSTDVDGDALTYSWSLVSVPAGSTAMLSNRTIVNPTFVADKKGTYTAQLVVNDGTFDSTPSQVSISDVNSPPVANAGPGQTVVTHTLVTLDGSHSTDVDGDALTYTWSILNAPAGSTAVLSNVHAVKPTFTVDLLGDYVIQLIVNDGTVNSNPATVTVTTENSPPVANAGPAQTVPLGSVVTLDGTGSSDVDNQTLTYSWSILSAPANSAAILSFPTSATPSFIADKAGNYVIQLIVNDGIVNSQPATVMISTINSIPVANPGAAQSVESGSLVALDGSGSSDADGDPLTFTWAILSQPAGGTALLSDIHAVNPTFVANVAVFYVVQLMVNDGKVDSPPMTVTITAESPLLKLSAPAGVSALPGQAVSLEFTVSNPGNVPAQGATVSEGPTTVSLGTVAPGQSLPAAFSVSASAVAPKGAAETDAGYLSRLQSSENQITSVQANLAWNDLGSAIFGPAAASTSVAEQFPIIAISLAAPATANSGDAITYTVTLTNVGHAAAAQAGGTIVLPNGAQQPLTATTIPAGASVQSTFTFSTPRTQSSGPITATASVAWQDGNANNYGPLSTSATIALLQPNQPPVVNAGQNQIIPFPNLYPLQGTVTDDGLPNGTLISTWTQISGPSQATFTDPHSPTSTVLLNAAGTYVFRLTGDDSQLQASADVTITTTAGNLPPVVKVGPDQIITLPINTVTVTGNATDDGLPTGSTLAYSWTKVAGPGMVSFASASSPNTTAVFSTEGSYILRLTVSDSQLTSSADVRITVVPHNNPPVANAGPNQTVFQPVTTVTLAGTASDDGLPAGSTLSTQWSVFSGPGTVTFADASALGTTATFSTAGVYVLRLTATDSVFAVHSDVIITVKPANLPPLVNAGPPQTLILPSNVSTLPLAPTLIPISTGFNNPIAADYHQPTNKVVMSVNYSSGQPHNFELVAQDGSRTQFSNISGLTDEVYIASARDEINGHSIGGFTAGEMFTGSGVGGVVVRISPDGTTVQNPWVTLPGEGGLLRGQLYIDRTGIFGGDLIIVTTTGNIWRVNSSGVAKKLANVGVPPEGLITIPNDPEHYGPWAGKILTGSENSGRLFAIDTENVVTVFDFGIFAEHIKLVNANENYFGVDFASAKLWGLPAAELAGMVGDILIGEESPGNLWQMHWNGTRFEGTRIAQVAQWEGATMAPAGIVQVASTTASVALNGTVSDDGLPAGGTLTSLWTKVSGPGTVTFVNPTAPVTTASFSQPGAYVLRLSATDSELTSTSDVTITISANTAPIVQAGPSQEITLPSTADLTGTVTDDGLPAGGQLSSFWTKLIGPGSVSFSAPSFDGTDNFSAVSNPSGPWTYGSTPTRGGVFTPYAFTGQVVGMPSWFKTAPTSGPTFPLLAYNNTAVSVTSGGLNIPPQTLLLHPGASGENSVLRFTAPADGSYLIQGRFYGVDTTTTDVSILLNASTTLLSGSITTRNVGVPFTFAKALKAGDNVDFSVGFGNGNNNSDSTGLQVIVTQAGSTSTTASFSSPGDYVLRLIGSDSELFSFSDTHVHVATPCISPATGLVGWWPGDGDTRDLANANAGVVEDGVTFVPGMVGQAFSLNGGLADVVVPASTALNVKSFTMNAWVFPLDVGVQRPIMEYSSTNGTIGVHLWENLNSSVQVTAGSVYANILDNGGGAHIISTGGGALQYKRWNHVALTYDQTTGIARIFVNGAFAAGLTLGIFTPRTNLPLYIGARPNSNHFLGNIDEPQVYNRALSPAEILAIYTAGNAGNCKSAGTQAPIVSAGIDHTIALPTTQVTLNGTATDPNGAQLSIAWTLDSGAGPVTFANPASATTDATFTNAGIYVVRLTASNSQFTASSTATITVVVPPNTAPVVDAGPDQVTQFPENFVTLNGSVTDDGLPLGSTVTQQWSKLTGPGSVTFSNATLPVTQATFSTVGTYTLKLTASDSQLSTSAVVSVTVNPATNQPPAVNPGPDQTVNLVGIAFFNGTVTDDGLPNGTLNITWKRISGPGAAIFTNPGAAVTKATFSAVGSYVLQLRASDSQFTSTADVTITVTDPSIPNGNLPPVVSAGTGQSIVLPQNSVTLNGSVTDDGFPSGGTLSQFWSMVTGPGKVTFANPNAAVTTATFTAVGTYVLRLTASDSELSSSSDVTVQVTSTATPGGVFITGHDPDGHAWRGDNGTGAQHILQRSVSYVTFGKANPRILLVASLIPVPSDADPRPGLIASGFNVFDVADDGSAGTPTLDLHTVDFANYDVIIVGSGILQSELDALNLRALELANFVNTGGGIVALSEGGGHGNTTHDRFAFLPFNISPVPLNQDEFLFELTPDGEALGLSAFDVNFNASHDIFQSSGGLAVIDTDENSNIISLAQRGRLIGASSLNKPPVVSAGADQILQLPSNTLTLAGSATDDGLPTGSTLTTQWKQVSGPAAVTFASPAQLQTQVTFTTAGVYVLRLIASDSQLFTVADVRVTVRSADGNQAPKVSAGTDQTINSASTFLNGAVSDDGLPVGGALTSTWSVAAGPGSVTFINPASPATQVVFGAAGTYFLALTASDSALTSSDIVRIVVTAAVNLAPSVSAGPDQTITFPVSSVTLNGSASDDGLPLGATLTYAWSELSGPAPVTFSNPAAAATQAGFTVPGTYVLQLAVSDSALTGTASARIIVNPEPTPPPVLSFTGLTDGQEITKPTPIIGSVSGGSWKLEYSLLDGSGNPTTFVQFASGTTAVNNGTLGTFDPTVLLNGQYLVRFTTIDAGAQTATATATVDVSRNTKVGNFTLSFNDLSVPMPGLPITVTRTYDSRDKHVGDFGVGWTLSLANVRVQKTGGPIGKGWDEEVQWSGFFPTYCLQTAQSHIVSVTFPDGKVYKFQPVNTPQCQQFVPIEVPQIGFTQIPTGSSTAGATLTAIGGDPDLLLDGAIPGPVNFLTFDLNFADFTQFRMTTAEGFTYILDQKLGATSVTDPNGNTLTINASGVVSSTGASVAFTRDTLGRITQITDPAGNALHYVYNAAGDLASFTDRASNATTYTYDSTHLLLNIIDARGVQVVKSTYDDQGRLISTTDANGNTITVAPDLAANHETITDRLGNPTLYEYDLDGNITRETDALGHVSSATFDANDNKLTETNALGKTSSFTYDALGNRLSETDPLGNVTRYTYNSRRQLLTMTDPQGHVATNTYDTNGNLLTSQDSLGKITTYTYNAQGLPLTVKDALGNTTSFIYDGNGNVTHQTDGLGNISSFTYDANGNKLTQTVTRTKADGTTESLSTQYQYDGNNRLVKTIYPDATFTQTAYNAIGKQSDVFDALNRKTHYDYDDNGRLTKTTYPDLTTESFTYDANDHRLTSIDRLNRTTSFTYDALGRLTKTTYPDSSVTQSVYDAIGQTTQTIDALNHATSYTFDDAGRRTSVTDALNHVTSFGYDNAGNQTSITDALNHTTQYVYDSANRRIKTIYPDLSSDSVTYDALGRQVAKTDQAGKVTQFGYDALGRLITVTQFLNGSPLITTYGYDEIGNRISQTDANSHVTKFAYDQLGRRTSRTLPAGMSETYGYDNLSNITARTDFNGHTTTYQYDTMNRLTMKTADAFFSTGACASGLCGATQVTYSYDDAGHRLSMTDASGTTNYTYDARDRLLTKATSAAGTLTYTYDAAGNMLSLVSSNAGGASMTYTYDPLNRLGSVTDASGATTYSYDAVGNLGGFAYPNGVSTSYNYNTLNRLTQMQSTCATGTGCGTPGAAISRYTYTLGAAGNRLSVAELGGRTVNYAYDDLYRLTSETISGGASQNGTVGYQYDSVGNRLQRNSSVPAIPATGLLNYDANDRTSTDPYDNNGNLLNAGTGSNIYDFENRLVQAGGVQLVYDGDGNRVSETVAGVTTKYLVADQNLTGYAQVIDELQGRAVTRTYSYGLELINERQTVAGTPKTSFYGYDGHGSVRFLTDSTGAVTDTYDYDAFGNLISSTGSTPNNYLFAGEQFDPLLGIYYNRARYYDQRAGRFWTMDTYVGDPSSPSSLHRYLYVANNPVNAHDRSGLQADLAELSVAESVGTTIFGLSTFQSQIVIGAVLGGLLNASLSAVVAALKGGSPEQIRDATASGALWGTLLGAAGGAAAAFTLGKIVLGIAGLGLGGYQSYSEYRQGNYGLATLYAALGLGSAVLSFLSLRAGIPVNQESSPTSSLGNLFRYISDGEFDAAMENGGRLPNVNQYGQPRDIALTTEEYTSTQAAEDELLMGAQNPGGATTSPTWGVEVSSDGLRFTYAGNSATNGALELRTPNSPQILRIWRLR